MSAPEPEPDAGSQFLLEIDLGIPHERSEDDAPPRSPTLTVTASPRRSPNRLPQAWMMWPENCRNFNPVLDDASEIRSYFCQRPNCRRLCDRPKLFHIAEYTYTGACQFDARVNTRELERRFGEYERLRQTPAGGSNQPRIRIFFPCAHYGGESTKTPCMRRFFSYCQAPIGVALTFKTDNFGLGFQAFTESITEASGSETKILHCWTKCPVQLLHKDFLADAELYSDKLQVTHAREAERDADIGGFRNPALYLTYTYATREIVVLTMSHAPLFRILRQAATAGVRATEDPFVLLVMFYAALLNAARRTAMLWRRRVSRDAKKFTSQDESNHAKLLEEFTRDRRHNLRSANSMKGIAQDIDIIRKEHLRFMHLRTVDGSLFRSIEDSLDTQHALALQLARVYTDCADAIQTSIEVLLGFSQLHNGLKMYQMAEDSRKQAEATEAIARDAKRDSEIMKTITVVTLVYLPATFVCTLLSMGIFNFDFSPQSDGGVKIARDGWLFFAISVPLTVLTLSLAYAWQRFTAPAPPRRDEDANSKPLYLKTSTSTTFLEKLHLKRRRKTWGTENTLPS